MQQPTCVSPDHQATLRQYGTIYLSNFRRQGLKRVFSPKMSRRWGRPGSHGRRDNELRRSRQQLACRLAGSDYQPKGRITKFQQSFLDAVLCHRRCAFWTLGKIFSWEDLGLEDGFVVRTGR